jgi:transcriptional regulator with XRE-family HTH domain
LDLPGQTGLKVAWGMTPGGFKAWRKALGLSQKKAADALGLKNRIVQYYEKGERDGEKVKIPKHVRLACYALSIGVPDYHGPGAEDGGGRRPKGKRKARADEVPAAEAAP